MASRTRAETLENLRAHGIEPEEAFLDDFTKFGKVTQDRLIENFKQLPNIESRYKFIKTAINESKILSKDKFTNVRLTSFLGVPYLKEKE